MDEVAFGRYRLLSVIGEGGMGKVYKAHDTVIGRDVAIKVLSPDLSAEQGYRERFRREAHTAARLTEPHVIPIHDAGEFEGQLYLVMPVIDGIDVDGLLQRDGPMSPQRAVHVIEQLAAALEAAHAVGLLHRDVKPSNALLTGRDFVYLIDFGIARDIGATKLTKTNSIVGTFAYMAPERFTTSTADARADVYALACVLYECLTGAPPFPGDSMEQQITGHLMLNPPAPSRVRSAVPAGFDGVIAAGMAKNPDQRYQTAIELADAARHALTATATAPATFAARPPAPAPGQVWQQPAPLTLAATHQHQPGWPPVPPPGPAAWPPAQIGTQMPRSGQRPRRGLKWPLIAVVAVILAAVGITGYVLRPHPPASQTPTARPSGRAALPAPPSGPTSTTSEPGAPVTATGLAGLLLSPAQINAAMGATGMTAGPTYTAMGDDSATVSDKACLPLYAPAQAQVYAGSGWTALRGQQIADHQNASVITSFVLQNVVLFPSAHVADAFFTASAQSWPACADRQFTLTVTGKPNQLYKVGPVVNTNGTLTATSAQQAQNGITCQRALTAANNVVIDVVACSFSQSDPSRNPVVDIAHQIAAQVPAAS